MVATASGAARAACALPGKLRRFRCGSSWAVQTGSTPAALRQSRAGCAQDGAPAKEVHVLLRRVYQLPDACCAQHRTGARHALLEEHGCCVHLRVSHAVRERGRLHHGTSARTAAACAAVVRAPRLVEAVRSKSSCRSSARRGDCASSDGPSRTSSAVAEVGTNRLVARRSCGAQRSSCKL